MIDMLISLWTTKKSSSDLQLDSLRFQKCVLPRLLVKMLSIRVFEFTLIRIGIVSFMLILWLVTFSINTYKT